MSTYSHITWKVACSVIALLIVFHGAVLHAAQYKAESSVSSNIKYNDNVYLTENDKTEASSIIVSPDIKLSIEDANWNADLRFLINANKYSDSELDSVEQHYIASAVHQRERSQYAIKGGYDVTSSLNTESSEFGLVRTQVNRTMGTLSPSYGFNITERMSTSLSYGYTDVAFDNTIDTGLVPYHTQVPSLSFMYRITELSQVSFLYSYTDYKRDDGQPGYDMNVVQLVYANQFDEKISGRFSIGQSKRNATTQTTTAPSFFLGTIIAPIISVDTENKGKVYSAELTQNIHNSAITYKVSQDNQASSFGGLDEVNSISIRADQKASELWGYALSTAYSEVTNIGSNTVDSNRNTLSFKGELRYRLQRNLRITGSYGYSSIEYDSLTSSSRLAANNIHLGLTYDFQDITSF